jgi:hypothetical protein
MSIYAALEMIVCELCGMCSEDGDVNDAIFIYSALDMTVCELCIVEFA